MLNQGLKGFVLSGTAAVGAEEMKAIELNCEHLGIMPAQLMENAAQCVAGFVRKKAKKGSSVLLFSGTGNNGGDGAACARHLINEYDVTAAFLKDIKDMKGPAKRNAMMLAGSRFVDVLEGAGNMRRGELARLMEGKAVIIDAIFGTGFSGSMPEWAKPAIEGINRYRMGHSVLVLSVDLPSGMDADLGAGRIMIKADYTLTFHRIKKGLLNSKMRQSTIVCGIGIPLDAELLCGPGDLWRAAQPRKLTSSKKENGIVLVIGGSNSYHGAAVTAANAAYATLAALRSGAGYAKLYVPQSILDITRGTSPNLIVGSMGNDFIDTDSVTVIENELEKADTVVLGMGLGRNEETLRAVRKLVSLAVGLGKKLVIDADAIYAVKGMRMRGAVLTPHMREMLSLSGKDLTNTPLEERIRVALDTAKRLNVTLVLKGHETIITDGKTLRLNKARTSALATMGTGDILAGIIGGYAATGSVLLHAAAAAVYLHSRIGDILAGEKGNHILAVDMLGRIPDVAKGFDKNI